MCGIVGIISKTRQAVPKQRIERLTCTLAHRGPDDHGVFTDQHVALGHTRLSILDLSDAGHQPMHKNGVTIVYNGEIYNFATLRQELIAKGVTFRSHSDTEVVLEGYRYFGLQIFARFDGMFACAIYDAPRQKLHLVRDRFGIKPLYLYEDASQYVFASEMRTLLQDPETEVSLDREALREYFQFHYIRHPRTSFRQIRKISPGTIETYDLKEGGYVSKRFGESEKRLPPPSIEAAVSQTDTLLQESVSAHMVSDVDVGLFLSGGVDSGMIGAIAAGQSTKPVQSFSVAFKDDAFFDESRYAQMVARQYGMKHHVVYADMEALDEHLDRAIRTMDDPIADSSVFLTHVIGAYAKEYVSVVLSGLGGDELFGGYNRHRAWILQRYLKHLPGIRHLTRVEQLVGSNRTGSIGNRIRQLVKMVDAIGMNANETYLRMISYMMLEHYDLGIQSDTLNEVLRYDMHYYMCDNLLAFSDRVSMAYGLEVRTPFLDLPLVDFAFSLPEHYKTTWKDQKIILKKAAESYLPKTVIYRRKQGFAAPVERWLRQIGETRCRAMIDKDKLAEIVDTVWIDNDICAFYQNGIDRSMQIYAAIVFTRWYRSIKEYL